MTEIIFAKPVHQYDSYTDFWRLVELSGFRTISVSDIDLTRDEVVITAPMNGDFKEHMVGNLKHWQETGKVAGGALHRQRVSGLPRQAHIVLWNLERPGGMSGSVGEYARESMSWIVNRWCDEVWVSDPTLADDTMLRYVILGSDYGLGEPGSNKNYDMVHMSVEIPRRANIYKRFRGIGPNCWDPQRDQVLKESRFALIVHQDNNPYVEPLRYALYAAYGLPVVTESVTSSYPYGGDIITADYPDLVNKLKECLEGDYATYQAMGQRLRDKLCRDFQFGSVVKQAIRESVGKGGGWR